MHVVMLVVSIMAVLELLFAQFHIKMTKLSSVEATGISLFSFIMFGLVSLFAVTRMQSGLRSRIFAVLITVLTGLCGTWYLNLVINDPMFFQNVFYVLNKRTGAYELLPFSQRLGPGVSFVSIIAGTAIYFAGALSILIALFLPGKDRPDEN